MQYDYIVVGSGLYGAVCARELHSKGKRVLVLEKRAHIGGNVYTEDVNGIHVHKYGAHIFHTNDKEVWDYVNSFAEFNNFINSPLALSKGKLFNLPFNMNTFNQLWGVQTPDEAFRIISEQREEMDGREPSNLEEQAIALVGRDIYEALIKGYTEKQWGRDCSEIPAFVIRRLPVRFTYNNNYFRDKYQGIPSGGYTRLVENMLKGIEVELQTDFLAKKDLFSNKADKIIYTGAIDEYFDYCFGRLEYRSLEFKTKVLEKENHQGNAVVNYCDRDVPFTRVIEHKHFDPVDTKHTVVTEEYPREWKEGDIPYYPINDDKNMALYKQYKELAEQGSVIFGGRLAEYKYYDMHNVIRAALDLARNLDE